MCTKGSQKESSGSCCMCLCPHWARYPVTMVFACDRNYLQSSLSFWTEDLGLGLTWHKSQSSWWWSRLWTCLNRPVNLQISACSFLPHPDLGRRIWVCLHLLLHVQADTPRKQPEICFGLSVWNHLHREDCGNGWNLTAETGTFQGEVFNCLVDWVIFMCFMSSEHCLNCIQLWCIQLQFLRTYEVIEVDFHMTRNATVQTISRSR